VTNSPGQATRPRYRTRAEQRFYDWFAADETMASRAVRLGVVLAPLLVAIAFDVSVCPSAAIAGLPCPGCGLTRATLALLQGDVALATSLQPLALVVCPVLGGAAAFACLRYLVTGRVAAHRWYAGPILVVSMVALTLVWAARWFGYFGGPVPV
jgi:hypothetical protein